MALGGVNEADEPVWSAFRFIRRPWTLVLASVFVLQRAVTVMLDPRTIWAGVSVAVSVVGVVIVAVAVASIVGHQFRGWGTRALAVGCVVSAAITFGAIVLFNTDIATLFIGDGARREIATEVQTFARLPTAGVALAGTLLLGRCLLRLLERAP